jgi:hypothetical protein
LAAILFSPAFVHAQVDIDKLEGTAEVYFRRTQVWHEVHDAPYRIVNGDRVRSGAGSSVSISFPDGSHILLGPSSEFVVDSGDKSEVLLGLNLGSLRAWVAHLSSRKAFHVKTPTAVCAVRGTQFIVDVSAAHETSVDVSEGVVSVKTLLGEELELGDNRQMRSIRIFPDRPLDLPPPPAGGGAPKAARAKLAAAAAARAAVAAAPKTAAAAAAGAAAKPAFATPLTVREEFRRDVQREVFLGMSREAVQAAAAHEARLAEYQEGKTLVDVNGQRVRLEEYVMRPAPDTFKLVALNSRAANLNFFTYQAQFNQTLPVDLRTAMRFLNGTDGAPPSFFIVNYQTVRSNTIDSIQEFGAGGHLVNTILTQDQTVYDPVQNIFRTVTAGSGFWKTLFDNYSYVVEGVEKFGWQPAAGAGVTSYDYVAGGINTRILGGGAACGAAGCAIAGPVTCTSSTCEAAARPSVTSTPDGAAILHDRAVISYAGDGSQETYDFHVIGNDGHQATAGDFGGIVNGQQYQNTLLKFNFEQIISATEFHGRKIDLVIEPKILINSGVIQ